MNDPLTYRAVDWSFTVTADDPVVLDTLRRVLVDLRAPGPADHAYHLRSPVGGAPGVVLLDGEELASSVDEALLYAIVLWHVNRGVVLAGADHVLLHAAAAERGGRAVLLPAPMESGKTTLVAGLVRAGLGYVTDETVALRPGDLRLTPYPKPLSIDDGSWDVLADLQPSLPLEARHLMTAQWQVPASSFGRVTGRSVTPALVVLPRYEAGAPTSLQPLAGVEALTDLLHSTFEIDRSAGRDFQTLARLARECACYRLVSGNLDEAVTAVLEALGAD